VLGAATTPLNEPDVTVSGAGAHGPNGDTYDNLVVDFGFRFSTPTLALVVYLRGYEQDGSPVLEWQTASEIGTLGFDLYRRTADGDWVLVNDDLVPALNTITGGTYSFRDTAISAAGTYTYKLIEWTDSGEQNFAGVTFVTINPPLRITTTVLEGAQLRLAWTGGAAPYHLEKQVNAAGTGVTRVAVPGAGWEEVPLADPTATSALVPVSDPAAFYRVRSGP
jgi:hypothetical protein